MLSVSEARKRILDGVFPLPAEVVPLTEACGRVSAAPVAALLSNPPADVSSMDGYAVRAADLSGGGVSLACIGNAPAGHPFPGRVGAGQCVRLFTGSLMPAGTDAVLIQENAQADGTAVTTTHTLRPGTYVRSQGQDFAAGQVIIPAGKRLSARDVGVAAAANHAWLAVTRRPRVAIAATGDELLLPGSPVGTGQIANSNTPMLAALLRAAGAEPVMLPALRDDMADLATLERMVDGVDMLVTAGGASVGSHDLVRRGLEQVGLKTDFWKIAMRPGKPLMSGHLGRLPFIGLPGNPVAAFVCSIVFVLPALRRMAGMAQPVEPVMRAVLGADVPANDQRMDHLRATLAHDAQGQLVATPFPVQDSAMLHILAQSQALVLRAPHAPAARRGEMCDIIRIDQAPA
ncbi:molybdopterin molybdenumtransferase MoeA [Komagataeibacter rhaeticus]|uniref:molybdopterin molybdotransferase MoeA n=1 Tax=Komagataeibacter rhaeticus TaxID=215221 RepID=UPI0004D56C82|nr:gephyrin-like molybdotransferase Glp [Komagataeibacter rhaeticus]KDU94602.1 molybdenum cofactor biosynthesis protein MoaA [Komagataeibacter rhaeticus AF1]MBL7238611.1 molybdopterin molybdotransferase MoeA [Komagataeibacter rhaeticus]PYD53644.1 molybdopterin molybdenumtransferase MoeA [Komagataeibacter rhaeticus]